MKFYFDKGIKRGISPLNIIIFLLFLLIIFAISIWIAVNLIKLLYYAAPVFLLIALLVRPVVIKSYLKKIVYYYKKSIGHGLLVTGLTILFLPIVCLYLCGKALLMRKVEKVIKPKEKEEYADFEVVEEKRLEG